MSGIRVAIIGAGPAGITLAKLLLNATGFEVFVYEKDPSRNFRSQGWILGLYDGLKPLREAGLLEAVMTAASYRSRSVQDHQHNVVFSADAPTRLPLGRPFFDRQLLREALIDALPPEVLQWDHNLERIDEKNRLWFNGKTEPEGPFDLVVGADGAWSHARKALSDETPQYSGVTAFFLHISKATFEADADLYKAFADRMAVNIGNQQAIVHSELKAGGIWAAVMIPGSEEECKAAGCDAEGHPDKKKLINVFHAWHPHFKALITHAEELVLRPFYVTAPGWFWEHKPGVTLIGDAAHLMTPFQGQGANCALVDSLSLAQQIIGAKEKNLPLDECVKAYEKEMFVRARGDTMRTYKATKICFCRPDAPFGTFKDILLLVFEPYLPKFMYPFAFCALLLVQWYLQVKTYLHQHK